jgi:hypothetical protein
MDRHHTVRDGGDETVVLDATLRCSISGSTLLHMIDHSVLEGGLP